MARLSTKDQLKTLVTKLGGEPEGETISELVDQVEDLAGQGGEVTPAQVAAAVEEYLSTHEGRLTDDDLDDIFA